MTAATLTEQQLEVQALDLAKRINRLLADVPNPVVLSALSQVLEAGLAGMDDAPQTEAARMLVDWLQERFPGCRTQ